MQCKNVFFFTTSLNSFKLLCIFFYVLPVLHFFWSKWHCLSLNCIDSILEMQKIKLWKSLLLLWKSLLSLWHRLLSFVSKWGGSFPTHFPVLKKTSGFFIFFSFHSEFSFCLFRYFNYSWKEFLDINSCICIHKGWALPWHPASIHPNPLVVVGVFINAVQRKWKIPH